MTGRNAFLVVAALLLCACDVQPPTEVPGPAFAATTTTSSAKVPFSTTVFVPCALDGVGENVSLEGTLHGLLHLTFDEAGGVHVRTHFQPQGVSGVGQTSGMQYRATGVTQEQQNIAAGGALEFTFVNNFRIIGQGSGNNLLIHQNVHVTFNANGDMTAEVDNFSAECQ